MWVSSRYRFNPFLAILLLPVLVCGQTSNPTSQTTPSSHAPAKTGPRKPSSPNDLRKAKQAYSRGIEAEKERDWQAAFESYSEALKWAPDNGEYLLRRDVARSRQVQVFVDRAERNAVSGHLAEARKELQAAIGLDPGDAILRERLAQLASSANPDLQQLLEKPTGEVHLAYQRGAHSFDYRGDTQGAYEEVARQFGVEVAFDVDLQPRQVRLRVSDVDFPGAMSVLGELTGTFWRPLTKRLFFVAADNPQKRREYDASIVRTVLLPASATPEDMTELLRMIRDIAGITRTELNTGNRTLTLRASPRAVALASALIEELEQPRGEVVLEIEILDVDRNYAQQLGLTPPQSTQIFTLNRQEVLQAQQSLEGLIGVLTQVFGQPSSLSGLTASQISSLLSSGQIGQSTLIPPLLAFGGGGSTFLATLPGAAANFSESLSLVRSGRRILLRAEDGQPASFFVGDRVPITLALFSPSLTAGQSVPSIPTTSFPKTDFPTGKGPAAVVTGMFNTNNANDHTDLAVANQSDNTVSILLNDGTGTFAAAPGAPPATGTRPVALATGSFNTNNVNDHTDLAVANFNCTGSPVVCGNGTLTILLANGDGTFKAAPGPPPATGKGPVAIATGKFNSKSASDHTDLAVANKFDNTVTILLANGNGTFTEPTGSPIPVGTNPSSIASGDFNGDGIADLAVTNQAGNTLTILLGNGDGTFKQAAGSPLTTGSSPASVVAADFNGDGFLDLAVANSSDNTVSVFLGNGNGTFAAKTDFPTGASPVALAAADFNVDGRIDLAAADLTANTVSILLNLGNGLFSPQFNLTVGGSPSAIASADFNGDGLPDLAVSNLASDTVSVILNSSSFQGSSVGLPLTPFPGSEYVDVGLKLKATPRVHPDDEISLHLEFEVRSLSGQNVNGIPIISNRTIEQTVRLRSSETSVLAGILQQQEMRAINGMPGFSELQGLNFLTGNRHLENQDTELLFLITPRIVRLAPRTDRSFYAGHEPGAGGAVPSFPTSP